MRICDARAFLEEIPCLLLMFKPQKIFKLLFTLSGLVLSFFSKLVDGSVGASESVNLGGYGGKLVLKNMKYKTMDDGTIKKGLTPKNITACASPFSHEKTTPGRSPSTKRKGLPKLWSVHCISLGSFYKTFWYKQ
ncbi:uncharacterized protein LOC106767394 [Vigna radiata var. radiata]|uniref:Uncharacterized protein LOC106767394 n=1 Tax=Vigna radiata var. radiata TaxID=3916 RepID=A0A3Q0F624_VIGRR|nr:uncharacterized protein LOC106767394 [Vigna radiata var. radiata]